MSHKFKTKQTVALAHGQREVYEIVRLMPETFSGEPQYRIKNVTTRRSVWCAKRKSALSEGQA